MKIEWASSFNPDGSRRKPDPSTMHGWYAKLRGTLSGNEDLRNKGMKEMRDAAKFKRERARKKREARKAEGRSIFSFVTNRLGKKSSKTSSRSSGRKSNTLSRPPASRHSTGTSRPKGSHASRSSPSHHHSSKSSHSRSHQSRSGRSRPEYSSRRSSRR